MKPIALFLVIASGLMSGCTLVDPIMPDVLGGATERPHATEQPHRKAWRLVSKRSDVQPVGNHRLEIIARGSLGNGVQKVEDTFLLRAAAETLRHGYQSFSIRYLTYESEFPVNATNAFHGHSDPVSISDYESYLSHTKEQRLFLSATALGFKRLKGVVLMVGETSETQTEGFNAQDVYTNLIANYRFR